MILEVDADSPVPPFDQVRAGIAGLITGGQLTAGTRLPTVRQLAGDLGLAPNTVARAYRELEADGLLDTRGRKGSFVAARAPKPSATERREALATAARDYARRAAELGVDAPDAIAAVRAALTDHTTAR